MSRHGADRRGAHFKPTPSIADPLDSPAYRGDAASRRRRDTCGGGRGRRFVASLVATALLLLGGVLLMLPVISACLAQVEAEATLEEWNERILSDTAAVDAAYEGMLAYNDLIRSGGAGAINDPFALDGSTIGDIVLPDGIVGTVDIPAMGISIPLYLGATPENLSVGLGVISGTSMPTGGADTNTVIAGHRGVNSGLTMFRDIEKLQPGDVVTVRTPWDVLDYRVSEMRVIDPDDTEAVGVQEGRELLTLLTCHPYGSNRTRMMVVCERDHGGDAESRDPSSRSVVEKMGDAVIATLVPTVSMESPSLMVEGTLRILGLVLVIGSLASIIVRLVRQR
ncbi:MAG: class C sortase [Collinsella sp.]|nr:class C sortase [Collinsella sp.]